MLDNFRPHHTLTPSFGSIYAKDFFSNSGGWDVAKLLTCFNYPSVKAILAIPSWDSEDSWIWALNKNESFSTKLAYHLALKDCVSPFSTTTPSLLFTKIWSSKVHPRHKLLWWSALNNASPVCDRLAQRFAINDMSCPLCYTEVETNLHLFWQCPLAARLWFSSIWGLRTQAFSFDSFEDLVFSILLELKSNFLPRSF